MDKQPPSRLAKILLLSVVAGVLLVLAGAVLTAGVAITSGIDASWLRWLAALGLGLVAPLLLGAIIGGRLPEQRVLVGFLGITAGLGALVAGLPWAVDAAHTRSGFQALFAGAPQAPSSPQSSSSPSSVSSPSSSKVDALPTAQLVGELATLTRGLRVRSQADHFWRVGGTPRAAREVITAANVKAIITPFYDQRRGTAPLAERRVDTSETLDAFLARYGALLQQRLSQDPSYAVERERFIALERALRTKLTDAVFFRLVPPTGKDVDVVICGGSAERDAVCLLSVVVDS